MEATKVISHEANLKCYDDYYDKPRWWFRLRYDTQSKKHTCLYLFSLSKKQREHLRILEFGFGSGAFLFTFPRSCELHGIELSTSAITRARLYAEKGGYKGFSFQRSSFPLPFPDGYMDLVVASHVLEHVPESASLLEETHRLLKNDGVAVFLVPVNERYDDPNHVRRYSLDSLCAEVARHGFSVMEKIENELLFHPIERFFCCGYKSRLGIFGLLISVAFNVPTALMPFPLQRLCDRILFSFGYKPRQAGVLVKKVPESVQTPMGG